METIVPQVNNIGPFISQSIYHILLDSIGSANPIRDLLLFLFLAVFAGSLCSPATQFECVEAYLGDEHTHNLPKLLLPPVS